MTQMRTTINIPEGWRLTSLSDISRVFSGSPAPQGKVYFDNGTHPFVRVSDLGNSQRTMCLKQIRDSVNDACVSKKKLILAKKGTLLFPKSGAAILNNNRAILGIDGYIVSHLAAIEADSTKVDPKYLYYYFCNLDMLDYCDNSGYPSLKLSVIKKIQIPLPPISEQKLIVSKLDAQMAQIELMKKDIDVKIDAISQLSTSILNKTFSEYKIPSGVENGN